VIWLPPADGQARLEESITRVSRVDPELAADPLLTPRQRYFLVGFALVALAGVVISPVDTAIGLMALVTAIYSAVVIYRAMLFVKARRSNNTVRVSDEEARAVPDADLPIYTILVPAYREPEVVGRLVANLSRLEYPHERLDIKFLLEEDDAETISAVANEATGSHMEAVIVPPGGPRTKPKALNFGLSLAHGEVVTIYDAEDQPEPLQLRRSAIALMRGGPNVACVQAKLSFANVRQNMITKWFTIEYDMWFSLFLPGLVETRAPIPLGGTSNHFRRDVLESLGAWDPYNVTEDADLGVRLARAGYRCEVIESVTLEEANSDFVNWVKQRSRWYKGYLQTALIHLRHPVRLYRQLGWQGFWGFALFVGGTPLLAFFNPLFWLMTGIWFAGGHLRLIQQLFPAPLFYPATACWVFGNFLAAYLTVLACRLVGRADLLPAALLVPVYWVMMAIAAAKAMWQLVFTPTFWEKTTHGLDQLVHPSPGPDQADTMGEVGANVH
jgi:cellulose synthase/poly-beta-1,6-N-acetylglucosamine synthase-like glycosyltransferase